MSSIYIKGLHRKISRLERKLALLEEFVDAVYNTADHLGDYATIEKIDNLKEKIK